MLALLLAAIVAAGAAAAPHSKPRRVLEGAKPAVLASFGDDHHARDLTLTPGAPRAGFLAAWFGDDLDLLSLQPLRVDGSARGPAVAFDPVKDGAVERIGTYAIAYDSSRKGYLLVYSPPNTSADAYSQRLDVRGRPLGTPVAVNDVAKDGIAIDVHALRYDPATRRFLLVSLGNSTTFPTTGDPYTALYAHSLDSRGRPVGGARPVLPPRYSCGLSDRPLAGNFLLACAGERGITGRRLSSTGRLHGPPLAILEYAPAGQLAGFGVAAGIHSGRWAVAYRDSRYAYVRMIGASGRLLSLRRFGGQPEYLPGNEGTASYPDMNPPAVSYSKRTRTFAVIWGGTSFDRTFDAPYTTVRSRLLDASGARALGPEHTVGGGLPGRGWVELVSAPGSGDGFLLLRTDSKAEPGGGETNFVYSQRLLPRGN